MDSSYIDETAKATQARAASSRRFLAGETYFRAYRAEGALELIRLNPRAFALLYVIASRARWRKGFNRYNLDIGQACLGDLDTVGMTEGQYRAAKKQLLRGGFATFKKTNRGTIATLTSTEVFDPFELRDDGQSDDQLTTGKRANDGQTTTNKKGKNSKETNNGISSKFLKGGRIDP